MYFSFRLGLVSFRRSDAGFQYKIVVLPSFYKIDGRVEWVNIGGAL